MKSHVFHSVLFLIVLLGCDDEQIKLNKNDELTFEGSFEVARHNGIQKVIEHSGEVTLNIKDGTYHGATHETYGSFAGKLEITFDRINFIDTLFMIYPANIIPPYVPQGKYLYTFNGTELTLKKKLNSGSIEQYMLNLQN